LGPAAGRALADRLHSVAIHLLRHARRRDHETGLGPARLSALSVIVFAGPISLGALAEAEQVKPPTASRLVAALEASGHVERRTNPGDHRAVELVATARGRRLLQLGRRWRVAAIEALLTGLGPVEQAELEGAVNGLEHALRESPRDPRPARGSRPPGSRRRTRWSRRS
jgi:DNA-binding MarR family transcriptional regulator